jgi:hypothetical protein
MKKKKTNINEISADYRECFATMYGRPEFAKFIKFLNIQKNNIAIIEWFRIKSTDAEIEIRRKKAYFEGQFDFINYLIKTFEESKKESKEE